MKSRWSISLLIIILTVIGAVCSQPNTVVNQEIILQFNDAEVSQDNVESVINTVKQELQGIGVNHFNVSENEYGKLKISYFSKVDVSILKRILIKKIRGNLNDSDDDENAPISFPSKDNFVAYNLDVYEIQQGNNPNSGLNGSLAIEINHKSDYFYNPTICASSSRVQVQSKDYNLKNTYKIRRNIALAIKDAFLNIPEVRAGPIC